MAPWGVTPETARAGTARRLHLPRPVGADLARRATPSWPATPHTSCRRSSGRDCAPGLRDARALAWRLGMVHRGPGDAGRAGHATARNAAGHVREIIDEAVAAGRVICELDPDRAAARDAEMRRRAARSRRGHPGAAAPPAGRAVADDPEPRRRRAAGAAGPGPGRRPDRPVRRHRRRRLAADQPRRGPAPRC